MASRIVIDRDILSPVKEMEIFVVGRQIGHNYGNAFYLWVRFLLRTRAKRVSQRSAKSRGFSPDHLNVHICAYDLNVYIFEKKDWDIVEIMVGTLLKYGWNMFRT